MNYPRPHARTFFRLLHRSSDDSGLALVLLLLAWLGLLPPQNATRSFAPLVPYCLLFPPWWSLDLESEEGLDPVRLAIFAVLNRVKQCYFYQDTRLPDFSPHT